MIVIYFDAAAVPNPGHIGLGWIIEINGYAKEYCEYGGWGTNNVGEHMALQKALETLRVSNVDLTQPVNIYGDSMLVVNQVNRKWKVKKKHLQPIVKKTQQLLEGVNWKLTWIPRGKNHRADKMSNVALLTVPK